jgi:cell division protein FtsW
LSSAVIKRQRSGRIVFPPREQNAVMPRLGRPDYILLFILMALLSVGFVMVFSISPTLGLRSGGDGLYYLKRHFVYLIAGFAALVLGLKIDYLNLKKWAAPSMAAIVLLLSAVFIPGMGRSIGGAVRWLDISLLQFQPSEVAKFVVVIFLAATLSGAAAERGGLLKLLFTALAPVALVVLLILKQPDLGTAIVISATTFFVLIVAGIDSKYLMTLAGLGALSVLILSLTSTYRFKRIVAFINPWKEPLDLGFHIIQSLLAVGSGGLLGLGLGGSRQKFFYLPQHYSDFIFSILAEELGFIGAVGVVILFTLFIIRGIRIARFSSDRFAMLLSSGIVAWIGLQALINICVVLGIVPTTGIPLPFISFGGTALIVTMYSVGVLLNISKTLTISDGVI